MYPAFLVAAVSSISLLRYQLYPKAPATEGFPIAFQLHIGSEGSGTLVGLVFLAFIFALLSYKHLQFKSMTSSLPSQMSY